MSDLHAPASDTAAFDDEPRTPMWLPAVGAALFLVVGIVWAITALSRPKADAAQAATVASSVSAAAASPSAAPLRLAAPPPPSSQPAGNAGGHEGVIRRMPAIGKQ
jgi:hypothetical protein